MGPMKATKKTVNVQGLDILLMKDGKIAKGWGFSNSMQMATQLGLVPGPKPAAPAKSAAPAKPAAPKK
jgi:hypothetical protein